MMQAVTSLATEYFATLQSNNSVMSPCSASF